MANHPDHFPIHPGSSKMLPTLPRFVPWLKLLPFESNAQRNHSQSLARLAERGGLSWTELRWIISGSGWASEGFREYRGERDPRMVSDEAASALWVMTKLEIVVA